MLFLAFLPFVLSLAVVIFVTHRVASVIVLYDTPLHRIENDMGRHMRSDHMGRDHMMFLFMRCRRMRWRTVTPAMTGFENDASGSQDAYKNYQQATQRQSPET